MKDEHRKYHQSYHKNCKYCFREEFYAAMNNSAARDIISINSNNNKIYGNNRYDRIDSNDIRHSRAV